VSLQETKEGTGKMMIDIDVAQLDGIVRAWLKDTLETVEGNLSQNYVHPDDAAIYQKDIDAFRWVLEYIGEN
jgi:hypothetical protein